jgi:hypothetical protein
VSPLLPDRIQFHTALLSRNYSLRTDSENGEIKFLFNKTNRRTNFPNLFLSRNCPKHVEFLDKNRFWKLVHLLVLLKKKFVTTHGHMNVKFGETSFIFKVLRVIHIWLRVRNSLLIVITYGCWDARCSQLVIKVSALSASWSHMVERRCSGTHS